MANKFKFDFKKIITGALFISVIIIILILQGAAGRKAVKNFEPTTFNTSKGGYKALYLLMKKLGHNVDRFMDKPDGLWKDNVDNLVIIRPYAGVLNEKKAKEVIKWVEEGNTLIIIDQDDSPFWKMLGLEYYLEQTKKVKETYSPVFDTDLTKGIKDLKIVGNWRIRELKPGKVSIDIHLNDDKGIFCAEVEKGEGRVILLSTPLMFDNEFLGNADNSVLAANIFKRLEGKTVTFDESFHSYYKKNGKVVRGTPEEDPFVFPPLSESLMMQVVVVVIVLFAAYMIRFGKPTSLSKDEIRMSSEYVHSLANLFQKSSSRQFVMENLLHNFRRRTSKVLGIPKLMQTEKILSALRGLHSINEGKVKRVLERCKAAAGNKDVSEKVLEECCRDIDEMTRELTSK